jgi:hypothetical protein
MRPLSSLISPRTSSASGPSSSRRRGSEKEVSEPKPAPKRRSLNEAAHKLDR